MQLENLNEVGKQVVERVIENAVKFLDDKDFHKIVDDILEYQVEETD